MTCLLSEEDVGDHVLPDLVVEIEVEPDDQAGDQHDHRPLHDLVLARPLDLLQLRPGLADEVRAPALVRRGGALLRRLLRTRGKRLLTAPRAACGGAVGADLGHRSASLPVRGVLPAPAAVLPELDPVRRVPLRFVGLVVAPLALGTGERDRNSDSGLGHVSPGGWVAQSMLTHRPWAAEV